jgi:hypothetical protein
MIAILSGKSNRSGVRLRSCAGRQVSARKVSGFRSQEQKREALNPQDAMRPEH